MPAVAVLRAYLEGLRAIHLSGEASTETSYYGQLEQLLNEVGKALSPAVTCVLTTKTARRRSARRWPVHRPPGGGVRAYSGRGR